MSGSPQQSFATTTSSRQLGLPDWLSSGMQNAAQLGQQATTNNATYAPFSQSTQQGLGQIESMGANPGSIPGYNQAFQQYNDTLGGNYLAGGQGFDQALTAAQNRIIPTVTSAFNSAGRMTGNAGQSELTRQIGDSFAGLYNNERQRQMGALGMAPQMQNLAFDPANRMLGAGAVREAKTLEEQQDEIRRAQQQAGLLGQMAPFYAQQSGTEDKPYFTGGGGIGQYLGAGLGLAGMLGFDPMGAAGDQIRDIFGMSAGEGSSGGVSTPPGGSSLFNSLFGGGAGGFAFPATLGAAGSTIGMGATGAMTAAELAGAAPFAFPSSLGLGGGAIGSGTTGMAAGSGAPGLLSGGMGTALGAAAPLALGAFGAMRQGARKKAGREAFAPHWETVKNTPVTTLNVPGKGAVSGRPFTDPSTGEQFIFHGDINQIGTGRSMSVIRLKDGAEGLWSPLGGGVQFGGAQGTDIYGTGGNFFDNDAAVALRNRQMAMMGDGG